MVDVVCCIYTLSYYLCNPDTAGSAAGQKQHAILIHPLSTCSVLLLCDTPLLCRYSLGSPVLRGNWNSWLNPDDGICLLCPAHARVDITYSIYCKKQPSFPLQLPLIYPSRTRGEGLTPTATPTYSYLSHSSDDAASAGVRRWREGDARRY
jgi:hypothetical protein